MLTFTYICDMRKRLLVTAVLATCCTVLYSHNIRHYDVSSGLSENTVKGITQDAYGYMWFGTQDGLNVFNGREFSSYGCSYHEMAGRDEGSLNIMAVLLHADGKRIWLVCRSTVTLFDPATHRYQDIEFPERIAPTCIAYAQKDCLWIGTENGLYSYSEKDNTVTRISLSNDTDYNHNINAILRDSRGIVWVCGDDGFFRYLPFTRQFERLSDRNALSVMEDASGGIWVGFWYDGFAKYNTGTNKIDVFPRTTEYGETLDILRVRSMLEEAPGNILLCTDKGLFRFSGSTGKLRKIILTAQRSTDNVYCCFKDREGGIWIGTYFKGLYYLLPKDGTIDAYTPENTPESFHGSAISSFCEDQMGNIWIGAENGGLSLYSASDNTFRPLPFPNPGNNLHALNIDKDQLYVGTFAQGMIRIDLTSGKRKTYLSNGPGSIPDNHVFSLFKLKDGRLLVGTRRGCALYDPLRETFTNLPFLADTFIYAICEDPQGRLWFADYHNGLYRMDSIGGDYRHYEHRDDDSSSLPCDRLVNVQMDDNGQLWISSDGGGLCRYDNDSDSFIPFVIHDGVQARRISVIYGCLNDKRGNLWISSNDGIWCCGADGSSRHLTGADGLQSNQFNYGAAFRSSQGKLLFGGINGFNVIDSDAVAAESPRPLLSATVSWNTEGSEYYISSRIIDREAVSVPRDINHFSINFECLSYLAPDNTSFLYRIDNDRITYATKRGSVAFADFPYGKHEITVTAITSRGIKSSNAVHIIILNRPPLYLSTGAKIIYILLLTLLILYGIRWIGKRKQEKVEKEAFQAKLNFFTQIAHEIKTPVTLIKGPLDLILRENHPEHERRYLEVIRKNATRLQELTGELLDFKKISAGGYVLNLKTIHPGQILDKVVDRFGGTQLGAIKISLKIDDNIGSCRLDPEAFTKIASNLVGNAAKHTRSFIKVDLSLIDGNLHLSVKDDGNGIPAKEALRVFDSFYQVTSSKEPRTPGVGLGLSLVKLLAEKHNGSAYVDTSYNNGCCVCVDIPYLPDGAKSAETAAEEKTAASGIRMLVVEDNTEMQDFLRSTLHEEYVVVEACNGEEALAILRDKDIDIIISDIYMPGSDGFTLLQGVRSDEMLCHIPVIFLTAESSLDTKIKGLEYGANAYIEKPFSVEQLHATIRNILRDREIMRKAFQSGNTLTQPHSIPQSPDALFLNRISGIILDRMGESLISVEELAETMNVSHSSLQRKIKGLTGLSPIEFIRNVKLKKAAELLASGQYRVNEVCYAVGFNKPAYFSACFKKQFGVLPKNYVKGK